MARICPGKVKPPPKASNPAAAAVRRPLPYRPTPNANAKETRGIWETGSREGCGARLWQAWPIRNASACAVR